MQKVTAGFFYHAKPNRKTSGQLIIAKSALVGESGDVAVKRQRFVRQGFSEKSGLNTET